MKSKFPQFRSLRKPIKHQCTPSIFWHNLAMCSWVTDNFTNFLHPFFRRAILFPSVPRVQDLPTPTKHNSWGRVRPIIGVPKAPFILSDFCCLFLETQQRFKVDWRSGKSRRKCTLFIPCSGVTGGGADRLSDTLQGVTVVGKNFCGQIYKELWTNEVGQVKMCGVTSSKRVIFEWNQ